MTLRLLFVVLLGIPAAHSTQFSFLQVKHPFTKTISALTAQFSPSVPAKGAEHDIVLASPPHGCSPLKESVNGSIVLAYRGNCTFIEKAQYALAAGAYALVIVNTEDKIQEMSGEYPSNITDRIYCVMIGQSDGEKIVKRLSESPSGFLWTPSRSYSAMVMLWIMAVATVWGGSLWASHTIPSTRQSSSETKEPADEDTEDMSVDITRNAAIAFVVFASLALVLLFFFMKYLIFVVIGAFAIGSVSAVHQCGTAALRSLGKRSTFLNRQVQIPSVGPCSIAALLMLPVAFGVSIWFVVCRNEPIAWIPQDAMGICLCMFFLKTFRFPNAKVSSILLCLAFFYDIFWVFLSPYLFRGKSVMVEVATGGGTHEAIPMLLRIPQLCQTCSPALLGLGDIVLPGLFVSYMRSFDVAMRAPLLRGYFLLNVCGYGIGLLITYAALFAMGVGQPALLYLVPCTLGITCLVAAVRGHFTKMWSGDVGNEVRLEKVDEEETPEDLRGTLLQQP